MTQWRMDKAKAPLTEHKHTQEGSGVTAWYHTVPCGHIKVVKQTDWKIVVFKPSLRCFVILYWCLNSDLLVFVLFESDIGYLKAYHSWG